MSALFCQTYLLDSAKEGDWVYHSSLVTDENPQELARQIVWSKLLDHVPGYLSYNMIPVCRIQVRIQSLKKNNDISKQDILFSKTLPFTCILLKQNVRSF